ncbi:hypothetical protein FI667_g14231, partial [Globisporangium splendens]
MRPLHQTTMGRPSVAMLTCASIFVLHALEMHSNAVFTRAYDLPMNAMCSASLPAHVEPEVSEHQWQLLAQILPHATSGRPIVRCELRAPVHIPCQLKPFPHLKSFYDQQFDVSIANFEQRIHICDSLVVNKQIKPFAQPPHLVFFDEHHGVVKAIPVGLDWTSFQLRDTILSHMANSQHGG